MADFLDVAERLYRSSYLDSDDKALFKKVFDAWDLLQGVYSKSQLELLNIESVYAAFEMAETLGSLRGLETNRIAELVPALRRVIVRTLDESIHYPVSATTKARIPKPYAAFIDLIWNISRKRPVSLITFNYDYALDFGLWAARQPIDYCLQEDSTTEKLPVLKLHGSVNWAYCTRCDEIAPKSFEEMERYGLRFECREPSSERLPVGNFGIAGTCAKCNYGFAKEPAIVPPTWNKTGAFRKATTRVWRRAAHDLSQAEDILIFGYSVPETDHFFTISMLSAQLATSDSSDSGSSIQTEMLNRDTDGFLAQQRARAFLFGMGRPESSNLRFRTFRTG